MTVTVAAPVAIPRALREAPLVRALSITMVLAVVAEPLGCPECGTARAFFVLEKKDMTSPWTYRCSLCHDGLS